MKNMMHDERGYSLVELIVSVLMFALGFLGVTKMQQHAIMGNSFSLQMGNALNIVDTQVERLRGLSVADADLVLGNHNASPVEEKGVVYNLTWSVSTTDLGPTVDAREVDLVVTWTEKGNSHSITMNMYKSS